MLSNVNDWRDIVDISCLFWENTFNVHVGLKLYFFIIREWTLANKRLLPLAAFEFFPKRYVLRDIA